MRILTCVVTLLAGLALVLPLHAADLSVQLPNERVVAVSEQQMGALPQHRIDVVDHGEAKQFSGVDLRDVLDLAGAPSTRKISGKLLSQVVVAQASDGYRAVITYAELDETLGNVKVYVATGVAGKALPAEHGGYRLIVVGDQRQARWVHNLAKLQISAVRD